MAKVRYAVLVNFDNVFHKSTMHAAFAAANGFEIVRNSMANGMHGFFGRVLTPGEFGKFIKKAEKTDETAAKVRSFASLMPLCASPNEYYCLMLAIEERPALAEAAAEGDRYSINQLKTTIKYSAKRNARESEEFAKRFQEFFGGGTYIKEEAVEMDTPLGKMPFVGTVISDEYERLMQLNKPIAGAYRQLSTLMDSATLYFSTQGSSMFAGIIAAAWSETIMLVRNAPGMAGQFGTLFKEGVLDANIHGSGTKIDINVPTDLRLLEVEGDPIENRLFSGHQMRDRLFGSEDGGKTRHAQVVFERESLPYENIWLLEGSYNKRALDGLGRRGFKNVIVVETNPGWKWNYDDARRNGVRVAGMENLAGDLAAMMFA